MILVIAGKLTKSHAGKLIVDATAYPPDMSYHTNLNLLSVASEKAEELTGFMSSPSLHT